MGNNKTDEVTEPVKVEKPVAEKKMFGGLQEAKGRVVCDFERCAGCHTCETVCSLINEGVVSPALSRIQVCISPIKSWRDEAFTCRQCRGPECLYACPTGAIYVVESTGARAIDPTKCIGCKLCMRACPASMPERIRYNAEKKVCFKCDLCGGDPQCVKFCPEGALKLKREV